MTTRTLAPESPLLDHQTAKPARWLVLLAASQVAVLSLDFFKLGLTTQGGTDVGRWVVIAPGQVIFGIVLIVLSPHLLRVLRDTPGSLMIAWFTWNFITAWWSVDPRQTVIQTVGAVNLFVFGAWFVYLFGITSWARVSAAAIGVIVAAGAYWQWLGPGPGFEDRFEGLSQGFNLQGILCAFAILAAAIALKGSKNHRRPIALAIVILFVCLGATGGRMGMIAIAGSLGVLFFNQLIAPRNRHRTFAALALLSVVSIIVFTRLDVYQREAADGPLNGRDILWGYAAELIADSPLSGHGMMAGESIWKAAFVAGVVDFAGGSAHNMIIDVTVGGGLIGLGLLVAALVVITRRLWARRSSVGLSLMLLVILAGLTESLVHRPGLTHWVLGALVALASQATESPHDVSTDDRPASTLAPQPLLGGRW